MPGGEEAKRHYYSSVLFCEGKDAKGFFAGLRRHLQVDVVRIEDIRGRDRLGPRLRAVLQGEGGQLVERVAVTLDAHTNPDGAFQAIQDALVAAGWPRPVRPLEEVVCGNDGRAVMAMVLPDSESEGQLEELCLRACGDEPVYQAAINLLEQIRREHDCNLERSIANTTASSTNSPSDKCRP